MKKDLEGVGEVRQVLKMGRKLDCRFDLASREMEAKEMGKEEVGRGEDFVGPKGKRSPHRQFRLDANDDALVHENRCKRANEISVRTGL